MARGSGSEAKVRSNRRSNRRGQRARFQRIGHGLFRYRATGVIYGVIKQRGRVVWRNLETTDKAEARKLLADALKNSEKVDTRLSRSLTFEQLIGLYNDSLDSFSPGTAENRRCLIRILKRTWTYGLDSMVAHITPVHLRNWLAAQKRRLCNTTWNTYLRLLRALFDLAVEARAMTENPTAGIKPLRREDPHRSTPTWEQFQAIVANVREQKYNARRSRSADLIEFMGCCGLGQAECHGLLGEHFDFVHQQITVFRQKTRKGFVIPMYPQALPILGRLRDEGRIQVGKPVFTWRSPEVALVHACKRLGFPRFTPRSLRRLFILRALERGIDPRVVAAWQGHVDGGTLVLRVYGAFIGREHAQQMASKLV